MEKKNKKTVTIEEVISNDYDMSETFSKFFTNFVPNLKIISNENCEIAIEYQREKPVQVAINRFKIRANKKKISQINPNKRFSFYPVSYNEVLKQVKSLDTKKAIEPKDAPTKLSK